jgi:hypothetical protein
MNVIRLHRILEQDGQLLLTGLPYHKGQVIELIVLGDEPSQEDVSPAHLTAADLLKSPLPGLWKDRSDITNSSDYARQLREQAQHRHIGERDDST